MNPLTDTEIAAIEDALLVVDQSGFCSFGCPYDVGLENCVGDDDWAECALLHRLIAYLEGWL